MAKLRRITVAEQMLRHNYQSINVYLAAFQRREEREGILGGNTGREE
jgi:hypothetical protein